MQHEKFTTMFKDEARIAAGLLHPNIAQIYDLGDDGEALFIALEYVRGQDLRCTYNRQTQDGCAIPLETAAHIVMDAAAGLGHAHGWRGIDGTPKSIVHRDISPQNILISYDGHVKVIDFGIAKARGKIGVTRVGVIKGKYSYMSPEQAAGEDLDGRSDVFALGITLFEISTGQRLFKRELELETLAAVIDCEVPAPSLLMPDYDPELERIVFRCLHPDRDQRYQSASELQQELQRFLVMRGYPPTPLALAKYMHGLFDEEASSHVDASKSSPEDEESQAAQGLNEEPVKKLSRDVSESHNSPNPAVDVADSVEPSISSSSGGTFNLGPRVGQIKPPSPLEPGLTELAPSPVIVPRSGKKFRNLLFAFASAAILAGTGFWFWTNGSDKTGDRVTDADQNLPPASASVASSKGLTLTSVPSGARVVFVGADAGNLNDHYGAMPTPITITDNVNVSPNTRIRFLLSGYQVAEIAVSDFVSGEQKPLERINVLLDPADD